MAMNRAPAMVRQTAPAPPAIEVPPTIEVTFLTADMAEAATALRGVERTDHRTVTFLSGDLLQAYRTFVTIVTLTRGLGD
jgi:D-amino peptidase